MDVDVLDFDVDVFDLEEDLLEVEVLVFVDGLETDVLVGVVNLVEDDIDDVEEDVEVRAGVLIRCFDEVDEVDVVVPCLWVEVLPVRPRS